MAKPCLYKKYKIRQAWWHEPIVPATLEADVGGSLEPREVKGTGSQDLEPRSSQDHTAL